MSKAFTKEDDGDGVILLPDLPQSPRPNYVTPVGLEALKGRLSARAAELAVTRARGDGLDIKYLIALAERDIRFIRARIDRAILIQPAEQPPDIVTFGAEVEVADEDDINHTYQIVGEDQADPSKGLIALYSPLAVALIGAGVGDSVEWHKPSGVVELVVNSIRQALVV